MRKPLLAANWKMHGDAAFAAAYAETLTSSPLPPGVQLLVLPPTPYVSVLARSVDRERVQIGVQNVHPEPQGAFTGELAAEMARDIGAAWALVGHSERRALFGDTDEVVARKVQAALRANLTPLLCVGETLAERDAGSAEAVVARQIRTVADVAGRDALAAVTVAYEPVWAIGTGRTATPGQAEDMHRTVRAEIAGVCGEDVARGMRILYGGSVKPDNAGALLARADIDGALVGGAALVAADFLRIAAAAVIRGSGR
jgi:triosephosphate isomerase (TIM)